MLPQPDAKHLVPGFTSFLGRQTGITNLLSSKGALSFMTTISGLQLRIFLGGVKGERSSESKIGPFWKVDQTFLILLI